MTIVSPPKALFGFLATLLLCGCATTSGVLVNPAAPKTTYHSAYVVVHGDRSSDMDANLQKALLRRGFSVTAGADASMAPEAELLVKYADDWKWDLAMYLHSFDLMIFDSKSKVLLATGSWKDSTLHGFRNSEKVVDGVVEQTLGKMRGP
jgi:hypothetical protein